jgi:hypothetical protein
MDLTEDKVADVLETFGIEAEVDEDLVSLGVINGVATLSFAVTLEILDIDKFAEALVHAKKELASFDDIDKVRVVVAA